jgi:hypothetical protein
VIRLGAPFSEVLAAVRGEPSRIKAQERIAALG